MESIHRDMKPQNIMITDGPRAKVMDFGLAKIVGDDINQTEAETQSLLTGQGVILGTVPYMSPEQVKGQTLDARTETLGTSSPSSEGSLRWSFPSPT